MPEISLLERSERGAALLRPGPAPADSNLGRLVFGVVLAAWAAIVVVISTHAIFVSTDTLSNYTHVWYVAEQIRHGHGIPLHMPVLARGQAYAFPYAFIPWTVSALLWIVLGERSVTIMLLLGFLAACASLFYAFPELGRGWRAACALANPALVISPLAGQLPFLWAIAGFAAGVGAWRRGHRRWAVVLIGLGQATHPAMVGPIGFICVLVWWRWEPDRKALVRHWLGAALITAPAAFLVLNSPVVGDTSTSYTIEQFVETLAERAPVFFIPMLIVAVERILRTRVGPVHPRRFAMFGPVIVAMALVTNIGLARVPVLRWGWGSLVRSPSHQIESFLATPDFQPGAVYRVLDGSDGKVSMYRAVRAGAILDSELFPESINRRSFDTPAEYEDFLVRRHVEFVVISNRYDRRYTTNEHALLQAMAAVGPNCSQGRPGASLITRSSGFDVFAVDTSCR